MLREFLRSKIHRATVTDADLNYEGSLTVDMELMRAAGMLPFEKVHILNVNNGARLETYLIEGEAGSGRICLNGAAARLGQPGDKLIILSYIHLEDKEISSHKPIVIYVDGDNRIAKDAE